MGKKIKMRTLRLSDELDQHLKDQAKAQGVAIGEYIRRKISDVTQPQSDTPIDQPQEIDTSPQPIEHVFSLDEIGPDPFRGGWSSQTR